MPYVARAVVVSGAGIPPSVQDVEIVDPVGDEVRVLVAATGLCHTDLAVAAGKLPCDFPVVLGHEAAGVVDACGPDVSRFAPGDRVVVSAAHHCGHCHACESGYPTLCIERFQARPRLRWNGSNILQGFGTGTFASATVLRERSLAPVPDAVPLKVAALAGCAVATGVGAVLNDAQVRAGSSVVVIGCGGVGLSAVMGAKVSGAARVVAVDPDPVRREVALSVGATEAVNPDADVLLGMESGGFDYALESAGSTDAMELAVQVTGMAGTIALMGLPGPDARLSLPVTAFINANQRLVGVNMGRARPHVDLPAIFRLYERGLLPLDALISGAFDLEDAPAAFAAAAAPGVLRLQLTTSVGP